MHGSDRSAGVGDGAAISRRALLKSGAAALAAGYSLDAIAASAARGAHRGIDQAAIRRLFGQTAKSLIVPGAFMVLRAPGVDITASYGTGSLGRERRIGPRDHLRIGSVTKTFTGTVILQAAQRGALSLDDPVSRFRPDPARRPTSRRSGVALSPRRTERRADHDRGPAVDAQRPLQLHAFAGAQPNDGQAAAARVPTAGPAADRIPSEVAPRARRAVRVLQHEHGAARPDRRAAARPAARGGVRAPSVRPVGDERVVHAGASSGWAPESTSPRLHVRHKRLDAPHRGIAPAPARRRRVRPAEATRRHDGQPLLGGGRGRRHLDRGGPRQMGQGHLRRLAAEPPLAAPAARQHPIHRPVESAPPATASRSPSSAGCTVTPASYPDSKRSPPMTRRANSRWSSAQTSAPHPEDSPARRPSPANRAPLRMNHTESPELITVAAHLGSCRAWAVGQGRISSWSELALSGLLWRTTPPALAPPFCSSIGRCQPPASRATPSRGSEDRAPRPQ